MASPVWVPSLLLSASERQPQDKETDTSTLHRTLKVARYSRAQIRAEKKTMYTAAEDLLHFAEGAASETVSEVSISDFIAKRKICTFLLKGPVDKKQSNEVEFLTIDDSLSAQNNEIEFLMQDYRRVLSENIKLKEKLLSFEVTVESFTNDDKVLYYTGLHCRKVLLAAFQHVEAYISLTAHSRLSKFEKLILTLMKLRLGTPIQDLAFRFDISYSVASKTFKNILHILYVRMKPLIYWPERKELQQSMPLSYRQHFGLKIAVIIDCFEIFIERPSNLMARVQTWSNYKSHNTVKYLINIVPQGVISFISQGWGGRTSDKLITEQCGLLEKLNPADVVLADRGFNIADSVGLMCAEVKIPAFTKEKKQLSAVDVESTRKIAQLRVNVDRVIGLARNKYTILKEILPVDFLMCEADNIPTVDKIVTVSCALTNCCKSIVRFH
ncbi:uncharacterized protein LOC100201601 isoform X4 [Hydra vulgaris]|uniref:uncharacterized protein LOC100201601 isoform X4 n=1 Tax=Hydra vulgaris TaxID=6087 RepID=UPI001F5F422A|nr:uncharacterized protein LOC100201601 isoform X3 [Hydra vulgaris]